MAKVLTEESNLQNIAAAIRRKKDDTVKYLPSEMAGAIDEIENYPEPFGEISITQNGLQNVKNYEFADVDVSAQIEPEDEGKVVVNGELVEQTSTTVTENDTYDTTTNNEVVVNVPNTYTAEDEGKVVDDGALVAQTSRTVTSNGTYDTTTNDEVVVNVSGGGGGGEQEEYVGDFTPASNANSARSGGWKFTPKKDLKIAGVRFFARDTTASVFISDTSGNTIASKTSVTVVADQWNDVKFDSPITLQANTQYVVWGSNANITMKYYSRSISPSLVTFGGSVWTSTASTFPTTTESNTTYGVDLIALVPVAVIEPLSVTQNGTYTPESGVDGFAPVTVNVSGGGDDDEPIPSVPSEYQKVEYIHIGVNNANQYITLLSVDANSTLKVKFRPLAVGEYPILAAKSGSYTTTQDDFELYFDSNTLLARLWARNGGNVDYLSAKGKCSYPQPVVNDTPSISNTEVIYTCEMGVKHAYPSDAYPNETIKIGYYQNNSNYRGYCYYVKVTAQSDDSLEYFLVPCYRKADGAIGFYDTVNDVFYTNEGSGSFDKGADVN